VQKVSEVAQDHLGTLDFVGHQLLRGEPRRISADVQVACVATIATVKTQGDVLTEAIVWWGSAKGVVDGKAARQASVSQTDAVIAMPVISIAVTPVSAWRSVASSFVSSVSYQAV
jgi:hypothetical protein